MGSGRRAWGFNSDLTLNEMKEPLGPFSLKPWGDRESDWKPDSIWGELSNETSLRIFHIGEDGVGFVVHLYFYSEDPMSREHAMDAQRDLLERVLPAIGARDVHPTSLLD